MIFGNIICVTERKYEQYCEFQFKFKYNNTTKLNCVTSGLDSLIFKSFLCYFIYNTNIICYTDVTLSF